MRKASFAKKLREIYINKNLNYTNYFSFDMPSVIDMRNLPEELKKELKKTKGFSLNTDFFNTFNFEKNNRKEEQISFSQNLLVEKISENLKKHNTIVSLGIGDGKIASRYIKNNTEIIGVDFVSSYLKKAKKIIPNLITIKHDLNKSDIPIEKESADIIECCMTMHHVEKYMDLLKESKRILKRKGLFFLVDVCDKTYIEKNMLFNEVHRHPNYHGAEFFRNTEEIKKQVGKYFKITEYVRIGPGLFYLSGKKNG